MVCLADKAQLSTEALMEKMDTVTATVEHLEDAHLMAAARPGSHLIVKRRTDKQVGQPRMGPLHHPQRRPIKSTKQYKVAAKCDCGWLVAAPAFNRVPMALCCTPTESACTFCHCDV